ncbi:universal stress protein [Streptomyces sp. NPDC057854]|uniref:universal stress protein n=1 Tax=unclassified Streptomyces TaxID=2593676 RepID=UPI0036C293EB
MTRLLSHPVRGHGHRPAQTGLVQPVAAVLTDRIDDVAVAEAAARMALVRRVPLLLIAVVPPHVGRSPLGPAACPSVRAVLARVMPKVGPHATGCIPEVFHLPAGNGSRLAAAKQLLALAGRHPGSGRGGLASRPARAGRARPDRGRSPARRPVRPCDRPCGLGAAAIALDVIASSA